MLENPASANQTELTGRALALGCALGIVLAVGNVYVGLKTGISDGGTVTAAIAGFAIMKAFAARGRHYTVLENNITQTAASSAAQMPAAMGFLGSFPALTIMGHRYPVWLMLTWGATIGVLGILLALNVRERFLVQDPLPFPGAVATAEVIKAMHRSGERAVGRGRALMGGGTLSMLVTWFRDGKPAAIPAATYLPFSVQGHPAAALTLGVSWSPLLLSIGMLIGPRTGFGLFVGAVVGWAGLAPWLVNTHAVADASFTSVVRWLIWPGAALMIAGALTAFARDWRLLARALRDIRAVRKADSTRGLVAQAALVAVLAVLGWVGFGIHPLPVVAATIFSFVMATVAARAAGEAAFMPLGTFGQLTQLLVGPASGSGSASILCASIPAGDAAQTGQMLETLKVGQLLGASARRQMTAQVVAAIAAAPFVVGAYVLLDRAYQLGGATLPVPTASTWKVLADLIQQGTTRMPPHAIPATAAAFAVGVVLTLIGEGRAYVPSPLAVGLAFVLGGNTAFPIAIGSLAYVVLARLRPAWTATYISSLAAGGFVGEGLMGIIIAILLVAGILP